MIVLGIETSCDETAVALIAREAEGGAGLILASALHSQEAAHAPYGGVVPEIAARSHLESLPPLISRAMTTAGLAFSDLAAIAATGGPGLIGGVIVGVMMAKSIALASARPFLAINHLEAHALSPRLASPTLNFPYLLLLVSGGHCQILAVEGVGRYRRLGTTIDDAAGEAFDKAAKLLGLGYPGGPAIERAARDGDQTRFPLPRPLAGRAGCDFSFSGLKTALRQRVLEAGGEAGPLDPQTRADLAAGFQAAVEGVVADRLAHGIALFSELYGAGRTLVAAGGVAANQGLRRLLAEIAAAAGMEMCVPPPELCTDNGAMVAWAGLERIAAHGAAAADPLDFAPRPRWPLARDGLHETA